MSEDTEQPGTDPAAGTPETAPLPPVEPTTTPQAVSAEGTPTSSEWPPPRTEGAGETPPPAVTPAAPAAFTPGTPAAFPPAPAGSSYPPPPPGSWAPPGATDPGPPTLDTPTAVPFTYPPSGDATYPGPGPAGGRRSTPGKLKAWLPVAIVAALIGGGIGAGVTALANNSNGGGGDNVTIHESAAAPGAAVLSGNVTIPQLVNKVIHSVVSIDVKSKGVEDEGTGMIITSDGEVLTNNHVIELYSEGANTGTITVTEYGQTKALPTTLVGYDQSKDVALLKINGATNLPTVTFGNSGKAVVGDAVVAIGNALGLAAGTPTVTQGIVSALGRSVTAGGAGTQTETLQNMIQTDAAINPGNSGGPLIDTSGQVIGMNTAVAGTSSDGTSSQNIGFAIPAASVEALISELQKGGQSGNGGAYLGVDITTLTPALRQQYGFTPTSGAVILSVVSGSPADKAGLVQGDVIVNINGTNITSSDGLQKVVENAKAGQSVPITYYVGDSKRTTTATLGSQAQAQQQQSTGNSGSTTNPFGGGGFPGFGNSGSTGGTP
ncbi:MAG TPA: trypsin-like peptidase domain-containing protein [Acidimicrobiales bacterium]